MVAAPLQECWPFSMPSCASPTLLFSSLRSQQVYLPKLGRSGCRVVTTASPRNFDLLAQRGAEKVFDYHDPECASKIREYTQDSVTRVLDCISEGDSPRTCEEAMSPKGGKIAFLLDATAPTRQDIVSKTLMAYSVTGEAYTKFGRHHPAVPEDFTYAKKFCALSEKLVWERKLLPHPARIEKDGLVGTLDGLQQYREGKVSGEKLVYRIEETP